MVPDNRELSQMKLAEKYRAGSFESVHDGGIRVGTPITQHLTGAGGRNPFGPAQILDRYRHAVKRPAPTPGLDLLISLAGLAERRILEHGDIRAQFWIGLTDPIQNASRDLDR